MTGGGDSAGIGAGREASSSPISGVPIAAAGIRAAAAEESIVMAAEGGPQVEQQTAPCLHGAGECWSHPSESAQWPSPS